MKDAKSKALDRKKEEKETDNLCKVCGKHKNHPKHKAHEEKGEKEKDNEKEE